MKREKSFAGSKKILLTIVILAFIIAGIKAYWDGYTTSYDPNCMIEYGNGECIDGYLRIPFNNPNQQNINRIKITVPYGIKTNITLPADFNVNEPLQPGKTGLLTLFSCEEDVDIRGFSIEWCCSGGCYRGNMLWPTSEVFIGVSE
jgi:hypothetical protein